MPVASRTQPSSTKIGTDTRIRLDMPSSIRPIITTTGMVVLKAR
jgi:predicted secreted protein